MIIQILVRFWLWHRDREFISICFVEIGAWYALSAIFAVSLLRNSCGTIAFCCSAILTVAFLVTGFYLGYWATGSGFGAHLIATSRLLARLVIEMFVYATCVVGTLWLLKKIRCQRFLAGI